MYQTPLFDETRLAALLAVARCGSPFAAARESGAQPITIYRQIDALEHSAGTRLFNRKRGQWVPTSLGQRLIHLAGEIERKLHDFSLAATAQDERATGLLRVTASDAMANFYLAGKLAGFAAASPGIAIELIVTNKRLDLAKGEADVAIRPHTQPGDGLVGRRAGRMAQALYASEAYLLNRPVIKSIHELKSQDIIGYGRDLQHFDAANWTSLATRGNVVARFNDITAMAKAVESGLGVAALPCFVGGMLHKTTRVIALGARYSTDIWLLCHESQRKNAKVKAFLRHFATQIGHDAELFDQRAEAAYSDI